MSGTTDEQRPHADMGAPLNGDARHALLASFAQLALSRRYREFGVDCIVRAANVARSTFYYHFSTKDDLLLENLRELIAALGATPVEASPSPELGRWIAHLWQHRSVAARLLIGRTGETLQSALTAELTTRIKTCHAGVITSASAALRAEQVAGSTMTILHAWLAHRISARPDEMAVAIWNAGQALSRPELAPR